MGFLTDSLGIPILFAFLAIVADFFGSICFFVGPLTRVAALGIAFQDAIDHRDSAGNEGSIGPRDVHWMTATSGLVHEEMHRADFTRFSGTFGMIQLWVNRPAEQISTPFYQDLTSDSILVIDLPGDTGTLRVIAGEAFGQLGPALTVTPINLRDPSLSSAGQIKLALPDATNTLLLVRSR